MRAQVQELVAWDDLIGDGSASGVRVNRVPRRDVESEVSNCAICQVAA